MKKVSIVIIILIIFCCGMLIGNVNSSYSHIFEEAKSEFEENIHIPNNEYQPKTLKPEEGILNKVAGIFDSLIDKVANKLA